MSRFVEADWGDGPFLTWEMFEHNLARHLGSLRGQQALAALEEALLALPQRRLVRGHLAAAGAVCTVGALVAYRQAQAEQCPVQQIIDRMSQGVACTDCLHPYGAHPGGGRCTAERRLLGGGTALCFCTGYEAAADDEYGGIDETRRAGVAAGLTRTLAEHLAYLNDEEFAQATPEERYTRALAWARRMQGKPDEVAA